jgi:type IV secretion system protein VirB4
MQGMDDHIAVLSGNKNTVAFMDRLMAEHGEDPAAWLPHFRAGHRSAGSAEAMGRLI